MPTGEGSERFIDPYSVRVIIALYKAILTGES